MEYISDGDMVLIQRDKTYRTFVLKKGRKVNLEKLSFYPDGAFGFCYGSSFQVEKQRIVPVSSAGRWKYGRTDQLGSGRDNRDIMDDGASQELTEQNITEMKGQGASGKEIVDSMIEHSSTFKARTKFSQEKYIKKKEKKYIPVIRVLRTTTKLLCDMYHERAPSKTCFLRSDALAQILTLANVHARCNMLVMETTQGLVSGAMLERMGGHGKLVQIFYGDFPVRNILESFGHLSESDKSILMKYPFHRIGALLSREEAESSSIIRDALATETDGGKMQLVQTGAESREELSECAEEAPIDEDVETEVEGHIRGQNQTEMRSQVARELTVKEMTVEESNEATLPPASKKLKVCETDDSSASLVSPTAQASEAETTGAENVQTEVAMDTEKQSEGQGQPSGERIERKRMREEAYKEAEELLRQREMDGLVVVSRFHPEPVLMSLLHFVAPSRPVVVYCNILEPLVQCYKSLKESGHTFSIQISETWTRHYQVLPERTHPEMSMDSRSGYILFTTKIKK